MKVGEFEIRATADLQEGMQLVHVQAFRGTNAVGYHFTVRSDLFGKNVPQDVIRFVMEAAAKALKPRS